LRSLFFIARHGQTVLNESGRYRGWSDGPDAQLNEDGIRSAHEEGKFLQKLKQPFSKIISSPLQRAVLTAAIIAEYLGVEFIEIDDRLLPLNVGDFKGQSKADHPIQPFLDNKNKRFPNGETINEFEYRQHEFAEDLLKIIEKEKSTEDPEVLVVAHVSNVMYWWNLQTGANSDEYLGETTDIISSGGIALIAEYTTIPIFKSNPEAESDHSIQIDISAVQGETGTGYEPAANKGPFSCANCEFFRSVDNSCGQDDMLKKSKQPRTSDGRIKVDPNACCEYVARVGNGK
jgi:broad specificity phosphatase PhoE